MCTRKNHNDRRKKIKKNTLEVPKTLTETEITDTFKKLVGDIDLNLESSHLDAKALEDVEETLLALKELYEKKYISDRVTTAFAFYINFYCSTNICNYKRTCYR